MRTKAKFFWSWCTKLVLSVLWLHKGPFTLTESKNKNVFFIQSLRWVPYDDNMRDHWVCKRHLNEVMSLINKVLCLHVWVSFHITRMGGSVVFMVDAHWDWIRSFLGRMHSFLLWDFWPITNYDILAAGLLSPRNRWFCVMFLIWRQTLFTLNWACANSVLGMCTS